MQTEHRPILEKQSPKDTNLPMELGAALSADLMPCHTEAWVAGAAGEERVPPVKGSLAASGSWRGQVGVIPGPLEPGIWV